MGPGGRKDEEDEMRDRALGYTMTSGPRLYQNHACICLDTGGRNEQTNKKTIRKALAAERQRQKQEPHGCA